ELKKLNDTVYGFDIKIAAEREKLQEVTTVIEEAGVEASATREEKAAYSGRGADIEREIEECNRLENTISGQNQETGEFNEKNQKQFEELKAERVKLGDELTALKVKQAGNDSELVSENAEMLRLKNEIVELLAAVEENNADIDRNEKVIAAADLSVVREGGQIDRESAERLTDVVAALAGLSARKQEIQTGLLRVDKEKSQIQAGLNELAERKFVWRNELVKIDSAMQYHHEKITEEYKMTYDDCLLIKDTDYNYNKGVAEANRLKRELMRFGPINANAVEDYARIKERYDSESLQKADLDKSIEDIRKIIKEMTHEMLTRFSTQFELIRVNFSRVFKELFAGGRADLILEEAEDPLEAGIEIVAEPPGKKLQSISLLSGGERALTAIAILFAILNLKPMPFCILDEIEAALDDANAERFAKYLHKFSAKTQFIVITHRKPTMELADSLYGVTMEEKGISKIVSVKLSDAVKNIG
ncbi:MAG: hypothetical protein LBS99_07025, partial [Clostridiales bacterium]|nr:hypothetical protein [Clostridiales bacterium]